MHSLGRSSQTSWFLFGAGSGVVLLALVGACSISTRTSEIDGYDAAVQSQAAEGALAFIRAYRAVEAPYRRQRPTSRIAVSVGVSPAQVAEVYPSDNAISSPFDQVALGRGGKGGDGGGAAHR